MGLLDLTGFTGPSRETVQKMRISWTDGQTRSWQTLAVAYNPGQISRQRTVSWNQIKVRFSGASVHSGLQQFAGLGPESLAFELFFDTYESGADVTLATRRIAALAEVDSKLDSPPVCRLSWGTQSEIFTGVLTSLDQRFTMFLGDGTPVRATLNLAFEEYLTTASATATELNPTDEVETRVAQRGDTLAGIAAREYRDPARWRDIAVANGITNPRVIDPGKALTIPKRKG